MQSDKEKNVTLIFGRALLGLYSNRMSGQEESEFDGRAIVIQDHGRKSIPS